MQRSAVMVGDKRGIWQVAFGVLLLVAFSASAFAQEEAAEAAAGLDVIEMFRTMGPTAWGVAIVLSASKDYRYSHLAKVVLAGLQEYQFQQETGHNLNRDDVLDTVRRSIQRATALTASDLKKGVSTLATIGSTAPFVGLLGTVVGVINAFVGIASTGSGGIGAVSAGIAEALVETALGLFVAIT